MKELLSDFYFWLVVDDRGDRGRFVSQLCVFVGCGLVVSGFLGALAKGAVNTLKKLGAATPFETLERAFPQFPSWWVPETFWGYFWALCLLAFGLLLAACVKQVQKFIER